MLFNKNNGYPLYRYDKIPQVILPVTNHDSHLNKTRRGFRCSIRPSRQTSIYSEQSNYSSKLSNASAEDFQEYFQDIKPAEIFEHYDLYSLAEFRVFIQTLFGYKKHIQNKHKKLLKRSGFTHFWAKVWAKMRATRSPSHMQHFIQQMHDELVEKEKQINQLRHLYSAYKDCQKSYRNF